MDIYKNDIYSGNNFLKSTDYVLKKATDLVWENISEEIKNTVYVVNSAASEILKNTMYILNSTASEIINESVKKIAKDGESISEAIKKLDDNMDKLNIFFEYIENNKTIFPSVYYNLLSLSVGNVWEIYFKDDNLDKLIKIIEFSLLDEKFKKYADSELIDLLGEIKTVTDSEISDINLNNRKKPIFTPKRIFKIIFLIGHIILGSPNITININSNNSVNNYSYKIINDVACICEGINSEVNANSAMNSADISQSYSDTLHKLEELIRQITPPAPNTEELTEPTEDRIQPDDLSEEN